MVGITIRAPTSVDDRLKAVVTSGESLRNSSVRFITGKNHVCLTPVLFVAAPHTETKYSGRINFSTAGLNSFCRNLILFSSRVEDDGHGVNAILCDIQDVVLCRISNVPRMILHNLESNRANRKGDLSLLPLIGSVLLENHVVVRVSRIPVGAKESFRLTCYRVGVLNFSAAGLNSFRRNLILFSSRVEDDRNRVNTILCDIQDVVISRISICAIIPVMILHNLESNITGSKIYFRLLPLIGSVLLESHVVSLKSRIPSCTKESRRLTCYRVGMSFLFAATLLLRTKYIEGQRSTLIVRCVLSIISTPISTIVVVRSDKTRTCCYFQQLT